MSAGVWRLPVEYARLAKVRPTFLALLTVVAGYYMAIAGPPDWRRMAWTLLGALLTGAGANAWNQLLERRRDARMLRTSERPLAAGRMSLRHGAAFAAGTTITGAGVLWIRSGPVAALLGLALVASYVLVYTPLKTRTRWCVAFGAVSGALPPLIGWAAAGRSLSPEAWTLFAILFFWQIPHFLVIAWIYRGDYRSGGFRMPSDEDGTRRTGVAVPIVGCAWALCAVSVLPAMLGMAGAVYLAGSILVGAGFIFALLRFVAGGDRRSAAAAVTASIFYLAFLVALMALDKA